MELGTPAFGAGLLQTIGIDSVPSGDNALVIAAFGRVLRRRAATAAAGQMPWQIDSMA